MATFSFSDLEPKFHQLFSKIPNLPENIKLWIVKFAPWINIVLIILVVPILLVILGLTTLLAPFGAFGWASAGQLRSVGIFGSEILYYIFFFIPLICEILALPGLFKRNASGWRFSYYAALVSGVGYVLSLNIGSVVSALFSLYILFQIRPYYAGLPVLPSAVPAAPSPPQQPPPPSASQPPSLPPSAPSS